MKKTKTIFFGTHEFAVTILEGLMNDPRFSIELVITQPDKPVGRKKVMTPPPVKVFANQHGLKVEQPKSLKKYHLSPITYHIGITAQYGLLIPEHILTAPTFGIINVHTSLLPKYRGASPIQSALIDGEKKTGVTIMKMGKGLDTGPILLQTETPIDKDETYLDLDARLAKLGTNTLLTALPQYIEGELTPEPQDEELMTTCGKLTRENGKIDWNKTADEIYNQYRGLNPWPGVWTTWDDKRLKLVKIKKTDKNIPAGQVKIDNNKLFIGCGKCAIEILELQLEGKPQMDNKTFTNGYKTIDGKMLQ